MSGKFIIRRSTNGEYYFQLHASNGEAILVSERYVAKASAERGIASVRVNAPDDARYERKPASNGQFMFNLLAANHEVIGTSERYTTVAARENGIASVKHHAPLARMEDLS